MAEKPYFILDAPSMLACLQIRGYPQVEWEDLIEGSEFLFALESDRVSRYAYPIEDADELE